jgi:hypothetical protein
MLVLVMVCFVVESAVGVVRCGMLWTSQLADQGVKKKLDYIIHCQGTVLYTEENVCIVTHFFYSIIISMNEMQCIMLHAYSRVVYRNASDGSSGISHKLRGDPGKMDIDGCYQKVGSHMLIRLLR